MLATHARPADQPAGLADYVLLDCIDEARHVRTVLTRAGQDVKAIGVVVGGVKVGRGKGQEPSRQSRAGEETAGAGLTVPAAN